MSRPVCRCAALALLASSIWAEPSMEQDARWAAFSQNGWSEDRRARPPADAPMVVILAMKQRNIENNFLQDRAQKITDPYTDDYAKYYSREEIAGFSGPSQQDVDTVTDFLHATKGAFTFSFGRDLCRFICTVQCVEEVFGTRLSVQKGPVEPGHSLFRAATPIHLPDNVAKALDGVSLNAPIFMPPRPRKQKQPKYIYPATGRWAPLFNPGAIPGDEFLTLRFVAYCKDGHANERLISEGLCAGGARGGEATNSTIVSFEVLVIQGPPQMLKTVLLPVAPDVLGERRALCEDSEDADTGEDEASEGEYAAPPSKDSKVRRCTEFNVTVAGIQNYAKTTAQIRAHFGDGSVTVFSNVNELPNTWPLPYTTPALLSKFYDMPLNKPIRHPRNAISVVEFLGQYYNPEDLETFFYMMGVMSYQEKGRENPITIGRDSPIAGSVLGGEAQLDLQYIMALAANVTTWFWSVPGTELATLQEPFLDWLMQLSDTPDHTIPLVHSVSYGDDELTMPSWFKTRVNQEFMKLALRGISVLVASGDDGAGGFKVALEGEDACHQARPEFPATSPWVTAVGGTQMAAMATPVCGYSSDNVIVNCREQKEVVCTSEKGGIITSGGGFSYMFERPWYQKGVPEKYLRKVDSLVQKNTSWKFNKEGRAIPDIASMASNFLVWMGDSLEPCSGTSAATPVVAAMVAHWNEARLMHGRPPLGFLNPLIYRLADRHPEGFNDVVMGNNRCSRSFCCEDGFAAVRGWDAATGFGSPKFGLLMTLLERNELTGPVIGYTAAAGNMDLAASAPLQTARVPGTYVERPQNLEQTYGAAVAATFMVLLAAVPFSVARCTRSERVLSWRSAPRSLRVDLLT